MNSTLTINNLTCQYENQNVLESLSLEVEQGEIVCLLGASGCGKTTLLKAIAGLLPLTSGSISLNGLLLDDGKTWLPPEQRHIGMIFQDYALFPHLTVADNIAFGLKNTSIHDTQKVVKEMLELVHLNGYQSRYPHQLSGGQQQRVAIARSLAYRPDLLLLDEPFSNIDSQVRHDLILQIRKMFKQQGVTAIFVTHSREEAFAFADKMAVMNHGVIEQFGETSELYHQPSSKFVADFLGSGCYLPATKITDSEFETVLGVVTAQSKDNIMIGDACHLLLRPQHLKITQDNSALAKVTERLFMGEQYSYVIDVDQVQLAATSTMAIEVGEAVRVELDSQEILAFL